MVMKGISSSEEQKRKTARKKKGGEDRDMMKTLTEIEVGATQLKEI